MQKYKDEHMERQMDEYVMRQELRQSQLMVHPRNVDLYIPPITWKGDCVGHIGRADTFFWLLEGECFLNINSQYFVLRPGQLAFLPKDKMRAYTHVSDNFCMYEMGFTAESDGENLMAQLGLTESNYVVDVPQKEEMSGYFEKSYHKEMFKNPVHNLGWCANLINIICLYVRERQNTDQSEERFFAPIKDYMLDNLNKTISTEELAGLVFMQPNYFIRRFKKAFGVPPMAYLARLRLYKAMELLISTEQSTEQIARQVGIEDTSYFARFFKKNSGVTPREYRKAFRK